MKRKEHGLGLQRGKAGHGHGYGEDEHGDDEDRLDYHVSFASQHAISMFFLGGGGLS